MPRIKLNRNTIGTNNQMYNYRGLIEYFILLKQRDVFYFPIYDLFFRCKNYPKMKC